MGLSARKMGEPGRQQQEPDADLSVGELWRKKTQIALQMKNIKHIIPILALAILSGCVTTPAGQARLDKAVAMIRYTVPAAVQVAVVEEPNSVAYLRASAEVIDAAAANTTSTPATLLKSLNAIPGSTPLARLAVMGGVGVYVAFFADQVTSDAGTVTVMRAISQAIRDGLGAPSGKRIKRSH